MDHHDIHRLPLDPDLETSDGGQQAQGLVVIRLYDSGQASGHSTNPPPPMTVAVIRTEMAAATDIVIRWHPAPT